jgi:tRNA(adenine34) deaminase
VTASFELKVREQVERLKRSPLAEIEREVAGKRIAWFQPGDTLPGMDSLPTPREAYEMLFFKYMGVAEADLPVVIEAGGEIVWLSRNPCPTLEACRELGMDTRQVCRAAYEKSTQAFVSQIDPQLRFMRSYREIRPYAEHCREWIVRVDFEAVMEAAIQEALIAKEEGSPPGGAVVALGNEIIGRGHNTMLIGNETGGHAEVSAIRAAVCWTGDSNLSGAILFSTCEPCPMCASLAARANLTAIVYGISMEQKARMENASAHPPAREASEDSPVMLEVIGGVLEERCRSLYA